MITSRTELTGLLVDGGVRRVALGLLGQSDARVLIADRAAGVAEDDAVGELAAMCAGLPLALAIIAAQAAQHRFPLRTLVRQLRSEGRLLDALDTGDVRTTARAVLSWSYETLSPGAQRLFRYLGLMTGADIAWPAMASLIGTRSRTLLAELLRANLVEEYLPGRFRLHDLLREYSAGLLAEETEQDRLAACTRMVDSYLHGALAADVALKAQRLRITVPPAGPGVEVPAITDYLSGLDWFAEAKACLMLGRTLLRQDRQHDAEGMFQSALRLFREFGGAAEEADVLTSIATLHLLRWQIEDAAAAAREALSLAETVRQLNCQAAALRIIGRCDLERGDHEQAVERCTAALELYRVTGDTEGEAAAQRWLGTAYRKLGRWDESVRHHERSLEIDIDLGDDYYVAVVLDQLGLTYVAMGRQTDAESAWQHSVAILDYLDHPQADTVRARLLKNEGSRSGTEPR
ncbi:tetratricopeptide repeat protein [Lentzea guizhouensis]|uniref:tetratricopeptide repeat protein n=1 Tax=Lentzea guizhouensis TaxID=1586287 RepID=UPI0012B69A94|nr:tetratricopeptide repeat protein [Lentzea guizhouensis]